MATDKTWRNVEYVECTEIEEGDTFECDINTGTELHEEIEVSSLKGTGFGTFDTVELSRDPYNVAHDKEFSLMVGGGKCNLSDNPKGRLTLTCSGSEGV